MFKFIDCFNFSVVLLLGVVSLMAGSTTGVLMSPWYGGYQTTTPPPYSYAATTYAKTVTTPVRRWSVIPQLTLPRDSTPTPLSVTLPRVTTPPRHRSTTRLRMLPHPTTPTLDLITPRSPDLLHRSCSFVLSWIETLQFLQSATPYPIHLATTPKKPHYAAPVYYSEEPKYCSLPSYYQTKAHKYYTSKAPEYYNITLRCSDLHTEVPKYSSAPSYYTAKAPEYYTTTYASPADNKETSKYDFEFCWCMVCSHLSVIF
jgi:hypothetical protein